MEVDCLWHSFKNNQRVEYFSQVSLAPVAVLYSIQTFLPFQSITMSFSAYLPDLAVWQRIRIDQMFSRLFALNAFHPLKIHIIHYKQYQRGMLVNPKDSHQNNGSDASLKDSLNLKVQYEESENQSQGGSGRREQLNEGRWSEEDNLRFVVFIHKHQEIFNSKHQRKSCKIFKLFSEHLLNRTPAQCRSHFQKFIIKFKTIAKLKRFYRKKFGDDLYNSEMQRLALYPISGHKVPEEVALQKKHKDFGVQTEESDSRSQSIGSMSAGQPSNGFKVVDYQEYLKLLGVNLQSLPENYYWPYYYLNNPQFV